MTPEELAEIEGRHEHHWKDTISTTECPTPQIWGGFRWLIEDHKKALEKIKELESRCPTLLCQMAFGVGKYEISKEEE